MSVSKREWVRESKITIKIKIKECSKILPDPKLLRVLGAEADLLLELLLLLLLFRPRLSCGVWNPEPSF